MQKFISYFIALVWLINGLILKVLNFEPRHQEIVARILGQDQAHSFTKFIGILEILMVVWILSKIKSKVCAITQIIIILLMNFIEFFLAKDLLLFGGFNLVLATVFVSLIYINEFALKPKNA